MNFTVELTTSPIRVSHDWDVLRNVIDVVPGTVLLEDADAPVLVIPVEAEDPMKAALFCDGLSKLVGFTILSGAIQPTLKIDFDVDQDDDTDGASTPVVDALSSWVDSVPEINARLNEHGTLVPG